MAKIDFVKNKWNTRAIGFSTRSVDFYHSPSLDLTSYRTGKLDLNNVNKGIFIGYTGTKKNVWYIVDKNGKTKIVSWIDFDEAHMSVPAMMVPLAAQTLQHVGYYTQEHEDKKQIAHSNKIEVHLFSSTASNPQHLKDGSVAINMDNTEPILLKPKQTELVQTGLSFHSNQHSYFELKPIIQSSMPHMHVLPGLVTSSMSNEMFLIVSNTSNKKIVIPQDINLAALQISTVQHINITCLPYCEHNMKTRSRTKFSRQQ